MELDEVMLELICWIMSALEVSRECPEYGCRDDDVPGLIALVDFMQYESKKLIRSANFEEATQ
jgi:hypothetical protein